MSPFPLYANASSGVVRNALTSLRLDTLSVSDAATVTNTPFSGQRQHDNLYDRQSAVPRPDAGFVPPVADGATFLFGPSAVDTVYGSGPLANAFSSLQGSASAAVAADSTRIGNAMFRPSLIPVRGEPFFASGEHTMLFAPAGINHLVTDTRANPDLAPLHVYGSVEIATADDGQTTARVDYLWGQMGNIAAGQTDTWFADPDAVPVTLNTPGPNALIFLKHPLIGYYIPLSPATASSGPPLYAGISMESPEASVTSPPGASGGSFKSFSRVPDAAAQVRWQDPDWGHVQLATLIRDVGIEGTSLREDVFGWGVHLSLVYQPVNDGSYRSKDFLAASVIHGEGIGNYIFDLNGLGGPDAAFTADRRLQALPVTAFYVGYTHWWTPMFLSAVVYSEVDLDSLASQTATAYRHGRYASANIIYRREIAAIVPTDPKAPKPKVHVFYTGLEILYGEKETLAAGHAEDVRAEWIVGFQY